MPHVQVIMVTKDMTNMKMSRKGTFEKTVVSGANHQTATLSLDKTANTALLLGYQGHLGAWSLDHGQLPKM